MAGLGTGRIYLLLLGVACACLYVGTGEDELISLNLKINKLNLTKRTEDGKLRAKNPFFFNLDIPSIFSMNLDTKKDQGTSLGLRVLHPLNRFLGLFGVDNEKKTEEGWSFPRRSGDDDYDYGRKKSGKGESLESQELDPLDP